MVSALTTPVANSAPQSTGVEAARGLEEVIVTSRRREESILEVPLAVSAFGEADLQVRGVDQMEELSNFTPGFHFNFENLGRADRGYNTLTFRGMDAGTFLVTRQPAQVFINGVPVVGGNLPGLLDVERTEVIKGPQSAYFGRSTFAGAVNFITRDPSFDWRGKLALDVATFDTSDVSLSIEGPLVGDWLAGRVTARQYQTGGQYRNYANRSEMLGARETKALTASFVAKPTDKLTLRTFLAAWTDDDGPDAAVRTGAAERNCDPLSQGQLTNTCGEVPFRLRPDQISNSMFIDEQFYRDIVQNGAGLAQVFDENFIRAAGLAREAAQVTFGANYVFDSDYSIDFNTGWNINNFQRMTGSTPYYPDRLTPNPNYGTIPGVRQYLEQLQSLTDQGNEGYGLELRLTSPDAARFRWLVGVSSHYQMAEGRPRGESATGFQDSSFTTKREGTANGVFAGTAFDVTDRLTLNLEARYQVDTVKSQVTQGPGGPGYTKGPLFKHDFTSFLPRGILEYTFSDDSNVYMSVAQGTRPGDFNTHLGFLNPEQIAEVEREGGTGTNIDEEKLTSYEIGWKGRFLDGRGRGTVAVYYGDWTNMQIFRNVQIGDITLGTNRSVELTTSSGESEIKGVEVEAWLAITDEFSVDMTGAYTDTEFGSEYLCNACVPIIGTTDVTGNVKARYPKTSGSFGLNYNTTLSTSQDFFARVDYLYKGTIYSSDANLAETGAAHKVNVRVGVDFDNLNIALYATNIFNDKTYSSIVDTINNLDRGTPIAGYPQGPARALSVVLPEKPTYGLKLTYEF
jgi:iron complex outermembrane receptor protein